MATATNYREFTVHPNNRHANGYNISALCQTVPALSPFVTQTPAGKASIDFANSEAVRLLNAALLEHDYGVQGFTLPRSSLCPPVPGRADYLHYLNDYLATLVSNPKGKTVNAIDIGTGASAIYPILGHALFNWQWVATDISQRSLNNVKRILAPNPNLVGAIRIRHQSNPSAYFADVIKKGESFDVTVCNPPFFKSEQDAAAANQRKTRNLGTQEGLNFGGKHNELWCEGGEIAFIIGMIEESKRYLGQVSCFTSLVSKQKSLAPIERQLKKHKAKYDIVEMGIGQKVSRFIAWRWKSE